MKMPRFQKYLILILMLCIGYSVFPQDLNIPQWPQFRGLNASGISLQDQSPPIKLDTARGTIWNSTIISGASSPCIWDEHIFLTGFDKDNQQLQLLSYNRLNGNLNWTRKIPANEIEPFHASASPADATPVTDGQRVYLHFGSFGLLAYDFDGNLIWTYEIPVNSDKFGTGTSPILADNLVILLTRRLPTQERYLLAVDKNTGNMAWRSDLIEAGYSTPVIWGKEVVVHCEGFLAGYSLTDGSNRWNVLVRTHGESTPVVNNDMLYVNTWHYLGDLDYPRVVPGILELLEQYDIDHDGRISREEFPGKIFPSAQKGKTNASGDNAKMHQEVWSWFESDKNDLMDTLELQRYLNFCVAIDHGILALEPGVETNNLTPHLLWRETENVAEVPSPIFFKDRVYVIKNGGFFSCIESSTGKLVYKTRIKGIGPVFASPVAAGNQVYVAAHNGKVITLAAGDDFKILSTTDFGEKILASPAIVDNKIFIRTETHLYAFGD